jgi:DNA-binding NarL/FixJ family response regulator
MRHGGRPSTRPALPQRRERARAHDLAARALLAEQSETRAWLHDRVLQLVEYVAAGGYADTPDPARLRRVAALAADELRAFVEGRSAGPAGELIPALGEVVRNAQLLAGDLRVRLVAGSAAEAVPPTAVTALAAATHESLVNVRKHAHAAHATVRCEVAAGLVRVRIEDDGVGFDPAAVSTGTGLRHSVRGRLAAAGGRAAIASTPGGGTVVTLEVALATPGDRGMKIRILLVDDFPLMREGIADALERDPALEVVGQADTGVEGLRLAHELRPDVILLDLHMPEMGGLMMLERLREELPQTRSLVMTASEKSETLLSAVAAGAAGYITKRSSRQEVCSAVVTVYGGGSVIAPHLAGHLLQQYQKAAKGDTDGLRNQLTVREQEVLRLVAQGLTDDQIARQIYVSPRTVQNHLARIRDKTGLRRRSELTRWAVIHAVY